MGLIRHSEVRWSAKEAVRLDLGDLARQGDAVVAAARTEAERVLAEARAERERLISTAAEKGHAEGLARGLEEGRVQGRAEGRAAAVDECRPRLAAVEAAWAEALGRFEAARDGMLLEARTDVLRLAATVAEMVTKRAVRLEPDRVADQLAAVLAAVAKGTRLVVATHPDDGPLVRDALPALVGRLAGAAHVEVTEDAALGRGSVVATTPGGGVIDASIASQLERIMEALLPEREAGGAKDAAAGGAGGDGGGA